jgi:hypothetical protein
MEKSFRPDYRMLTIKTADGEIIQGSVNIASKERVSDMFTKGDSPFIVLTNVIFKDCEIRTLIVNKNHILWAEPED